MSRKTLSCLVMLITFGLTILPLLARTETVSAATWYVDAGESIQAAVSAAGPGDTIVVRAGTYYENVVVDRELTIVSESGAEATIVEGIDQNTQVFVVNGASHVTISGFTVRKNRWDISSMAIATGSSYCTISNNMMEGIVIIASSSNNAVFNNSISNSWAGVYVDTASGNTIFANNFSGNGSNVVSISSSNSWSSSEQFSYSYQGNTYTSYLGNYWSDYGGSDIDGNGIGDSPHAAGPDQDNYPLMLPFDNYVASAGNTPLGSPVTVPLSCAWVTFDQVTVEGNTSCTTQQSNPGGGIPEGFRVQGLFTDVTTTATYSGPITICLPYNPSTPNPQNLKIFHWEGGRWVDVTTGVDTVNHRVCGEVSSLSWFFIGGQWVWVDDGAHGVPAFPSIYIGIGAALATGLLAYFVRRRLVPHS